MYIDISYSQKMHHYVQSFNFADSSENSTHKKACNSQNKQRQTSILFSTLQWPYISIMTSHIIGNSLESLQNNFFRQVNNKQNLQAPHYLPLYQWATSGVASNRVSNARNIPCRDVFMALMQQGWISSAIAHEKIFAHTLSAKDMGCYEITMETLVCDL